MKKSILFTLSVICVLMLLSGCGGSNKLVGVWEEIDGDGILYFAEDNTGLSSKVSYTSEAFKYEAKGETLTFIAEATVETNYTVDGEILTISVDGADYKYKFVNMSDSELDEYLVGNGMKEEALPEEIHTTSDETTSDETVSEEIPDEDSSDTSDAPEGTPDDEEIAKSIVGAWRGGDDSVSMIYVFYEDGRGAAAIIPFNYTVKEGVITIEMNVSGETLTGSGRYDVEGDRMYIENFDGREYVLQRTEMPELPNIPK